MLLPKAYIINANTLYTICFDDVFILGQDQEVKVSKIKVTYLLNDNIKGIQFTYNVISSKQTIKGFYMSSYSNQNELL